MMKRFKLTFQILKIAVSTLVVIFTSSCEGGNFSALSIEYPSGSGTDGKGDSRKDYTVEVEYKRMIVDLIMYNGNNVSSYWNPLSDDEVQFECNDGETVNSVTVRSISSDEVSVTFENYNIEINCSLDGPPSSKTWYSQPCVVEYLTNCYYDVGTIKVVITVSVKQL